MRSAMVGYQWQKNTESGYQWFYQIQWTFSIQANTAPRHNVRIKHVQFYTIFPWHTIVTYCLLLTDIGFLCRRKIAQG
jgi:hypothetical protein